jgi:transcriptional regulator of arginine metabolism
MKAGAGAPKVGKPQRQHRIAQIIEAQAVSSQAQVVEILATEGIDATQTTVSRDLEELGAIKVRIGGGQTVYGLPELPVRQVAPEDHLRRVMGEWVVEVGHSANLVVLRTPPGSAHVVGSALDRSRMAGVVGTVAGDDTVLVVASEDIGGSVLAGRLSEISGVAEEGAGSFGGEASSDAKKDALAGESEKKDALAHESERMDAVPGDSEKKDAVPGDKKRGK